MLLPYCELKNEKINKVSYQITQLLTVAIDFTGLNFLITKLHRRNRRGFIHKSKIPMQEVHLKMGGGLIHKGSYSRDTTVIVTVEAGV